MSQLTLDGKSTLQTTSEIGEPISYMTTEYATLTRFFVGSAKDFFHVPGREGKYTEATYEDVFLSMGDLWWQESEAIIASQSLTENSCSLLPTGKFPSSQAALESDTGAAISYEEDEGCFTGVFSLPRRKQVLKIEHLTVDLKKLQRRRPHIEIDSSFFDEEDDEQ